MNSSNESLEPHRGIWPAARISFAVVLVGALLYFVGVKELWNVLRNIELIYIVYLALLTVILIWVSSLKWKLLVRATGHDVPLVRLMKYYTTSYFFNMFMPSTVGGDVARSVQLGKHLNSYKSAFAATFIERFTGFLAMTAVGVIFVLLGAEATNGLEVLVMGIALFAMLMTGLLFSPALSKAAAGAVARLFRALGRHRSAEKVERLAQGVINAVAFARNNPAVIVKALALSLAFHILAVVNTYVAALAIGWKDADFMGLCVAVPLVLLVSIAPVTPSGLGIQEGAFVFFLSRVGASEAQALAVAIVIRAKNILTALVGGCLWLLAKESPKETPEEKPKDEKDGPEERSIELALEQER